jgi:hypothetical protein
MFAVFAGGCFAQRGVAVLQEACDNGDAKACHDLGEVYLELRSTLLWEG